MPEEKAGIFTNPPAEMWVWEGNELYDSLGKMIAEVRTDVIYVAGERLLVEYSPGPFRFRARATSANGDVFTLWQAGYTVSKLAADCAGRSYRLDRTSAWRKERRILDPQGQLVATVRPLVSGKVEITDHTAAGDLPTVDTVFLTWGCVLVDSAVRRPRLA